jgi:hypothetical protein
LDFTTNTLSWSKNGVAQSSVTIAPGTYTPAVSVYSTDRITANFGASSFAYPVPSTFAAGFTGTPLN